MEHDDAIEALRDKLEKARLNREELERIYPPSILKKRRVGLPAYVPYSFQKFRQETEKKQNPKLAPAKHPISKEKQQKYLAEFEKAITSGKFSHLSEEQLAELTQEIKSAASDSDKIEELESFLRKVFGVEGVCSVTFLKEALDRFALLKSK